MATFQLDLVTPDKVLFSGPVDQVDVPGVDGDFGVLAGHAPLVAMMSPACWSCTKAASSIAWW